MIAYRRIDPETGNTEICRAPRIRGIKRQPSQVEIVHTDFDWYPINVVSQKETLAQILLEDRGFATFVPVKGEYRFQNQHTRRIRKKVSVDIKILPGLVFVGFPINRPAEWHRVINLDLFIKVISITNQQPVRMRHSSIFRMMERYGRGRYVAPEEHAVMQTGQEFSVGDRVRVNSGPLETLVFEVAAITGERARVFTKEMGGHAGFDVHVDMCEPVETDGF